MKTPILILHGWMVGGERYEKIADIFEKHGHPVYAPDLPGVGEVALTKEVMHLDDYVDWVMEYLKKHKIKKAIVIGHSFGGRIATKLAITHPKTIEKLILTGAPLIKRKLSFKKQMVALAAKTGKKIMSHAPQPVVNIFRKGLYYSIGEWDYYKAGRMKETFKAIVNEDLVSVLPKISVPTHIIWGDLDTFVPLRDGKEIAAKIKESTLDVIHNASHKLPYEMPREFAESVLEFIRG